MFTKLFSTISVCYAGPLVNFQTSKGISSRRSKKREGSSEDDGPAILGVDDLRNEDYRCGGPTLVRLPALNQHLRQDDPLRVLYTVDLQGPVERVLEKWNVRWRIIRPIRRGHDTGGLITWNETVLVSAYKDDLDSSWLNACKDIRDIFIRHGKTNLTIEIIDDKAVEECMVSHPIPTGDPFIHTWRDLRPQVLTILNDNEWTLLSVHLRSQQTRPSSTTYTIVICIREDSTQDWTGIRDAIVQVLDQQKLDYLAVEIIRDSIFPCSNQVGILTERDWNVNCKLGGSLGLRGNDESSSTFGGFLELQNHSGQWKMFGVTNYHCVTPGRSDIMWERHGLRPGDNELVIEHPSSSDHKASIEHYEKASGSIRSKEFLVLKERIESEDPSVPRSSQMGYQKDQNTIHEYNRIMKLAYDFHQQGSQYLGTIFAASGYRFTPDNRILDWALIDVRRDRISENAIPLPEDLPESRGHGYYPASDTIGAARDTEADMSVFKIGRSTGFTKGRLGGMPVADMQSWFQDKDGNWQKVNGALREVHAVAPKAGFVASGDSGSFIIDAEGRFLGLCVGGSPTLGTGYFIEAKPLFEDIKHITGAKAVRVPT